MGHREGRKKLTWGGAATTATECSLKKEENSQTFRVNAFQSWLGLKLFSAPFSEEKTQKKKKKKVKPSQAKNPFVLFVP